MNVGIIDIDAIVRELTLIKGQVALVDDSDFDDLSQFNWRLSSNGYVIRVIASDSGNKRTEYLHRRILNAPTHLVVDHINHNPLDNRKRNLRLVSIAQNVRNQIVKSGRGTSRFKGVSWSKDKGRWRATIKIDRKQKFLGYFETETDAARSYNDAAIEIDPHYSLNEIEETRNDTSFSKI